ncbi:MAG: hypothetical protein ACI39W_10000 [Brotaphodocola sp.]
MKKWKQGLSVLLAAGIMASAFAGTAMAAEDREKISSVKLNIESSIEAGDDSSDVTVTANSNYYDVTDVDVINDEGNWVSGDQPKIEITLEADSDYYFGSMTSSKVTLTGDDADYVSSKRQDSNSTLIITVKLEELVGDLEVEDVAWENDNSTTACWEEAEGAQKYQVKLYRGSSSVGSTVTTTDTSYNFYSSITREGEYSFKVRALDKNNEKGEWVESDSMYVDEDMLDDIKAGYYSSGSSSSGTSTTPSVSVSAGWVLDSVGWWYRFTDGSYPTNGWLQIGGVWYCFDAVGYMRTGWIQAGNAWYYCDTVSGGMLTNTYTPDGYYVDANGVWIP